MNPSVAHARLTPDACARRIMDTVPLVMRVMRAEMRRQGDHALSVPQFRALAFVGRNPGAALAALAEHLGVTPATVSTTIDRLVRRGLVGRAAHPQERRRVALTLTRAGVRLLQRARTTTRRKMADLLESLSTDALRQAAEGLDVLSEVFGSALKEGPRGQSDRRR